MLTVRLALSLFATLPLFAATDPDVQDIVRKSLAREIRNQRRLADYTWEQKSVQIFYDKSGKVNKTETEVHEHVNIDGSSYRKLVEKDGKPLSAKDAAKEQEKMDEEIERRRSESESERRKRLAKEEEARKESVQFREEVLKAFDFKLLGEESVNGFPCWRIQGEPRPGYEGKNRRSKTLEKIRGQIWVEKSTYEWLKFDVQTTDKISFGGFLASVAAGATIQGQQMRVNNELWHPEWVKVRVNARALVKTFNVGAETAYRNFRKFSTDSRILETVELEEPAAKPPAN